MKDKEFLKAELLNSLSEELIKYGFQSNRKLGEFVSKNKGGWKKFQIIFIDRNNGWELNPAVLVRFDIVEDLFHKFSSFEDKYKKGTPTIGSTIEDYNEDNKQYRFNLLTDSQIGLASQTLLSIFKEDALPFFNRHVTLKDIDAVLNDDPENIKLTGGIFKGSKAIIIARLTNRENFSELKEFYNNYYYSFCDGYYLPNYINLVRFLDNEVIIMEPASISEG